jgi:RNA polymerase sigma-70 factor (ECF subfamily)
MDDNLLVHQAKNGSLEAFSALMELYQGKVYNLALRMTGSAEDAADLCQETFINVWKGLPNFQGGSAFSTWLYRLTNNVCIDFIRREKKRRGQDVLSLNDDEKDFDELIPDETPGPQARLEEKERRAALERGLQKLSEEHRQVLLLREISGLSYTEIAAILGVEEGTVKSRIARARLSLRNILREEGNFFEGPSSKK